MEEMDVSRRRAGARTVVVAGSVWESRMRSDDVTGGLKFFNGDEKTEESTDNSNAGNNASRIKRTGPVGGKRKAWKPEGGDGPSPQISSARGKPELSKNRDEMAKEVSVSDTKKSPAAAKRGKRDAGSGADQAIQRSPVQVRRSRSEAVRGSVERSSGELRKVKSDSSKILNKSKRDDDDGKSGENAVRLSAANSEPPGVLDGSCQEECQEEEEDEEEEKEAIDGSADAYEEDPVGESKPDEVLKEVISSNVSLLKPAPKEASRGDDGSSNDNAAKDLVEEEEEDEEEEEFSEELEEGEGEFDEDTQTEPESKTSEIKEIVRTEQKARDDVVKEEETKPNRVTENPKPISPIAKKQPPPPPVVKKTRIRRKIANPTPSNTFTCSSNVHKQPPPVTRLSSLHRNFATKTNSFSDKYERFPERQNKLQMDEEEREEEFSEELEEEEGEGEFDEDTDTGPENKTLQTKEIAATEQKARDDVVKEEETKPNQVTENPKPISPIVKKQPPPPPVAKQTRVHRNIANPTPSNTFTSSSNVHNQSPLTRRSSLHRNFATKTNSFSDKYERFPERQNKLQSLVDLVMWRDVSKSALIFGLGTFVVISSSYTKDINFSFITVISYLGLFYLGAIFLFRSIICRGYVDTDGSSCVLGEEEAIWLMKLVLPYLNEFLLKLRALFSGDPGTTMKLAVLLFVLARCGSSITIWKMAKFGFFGVFTVPKVCSSYSSQITAYGKFYILRFKDAWDKCSQKKAVAAGIFTLVWNLCSVVARIWAVFMLYVAFRYYQQNLAREYWAKENECADDKCRGQVDGPNIVESSKGKKAS